MKKIMFNDTYGLTKAVLEGRKTMTRRMAEKNLVEDMDGELCWDGEFKKPKYKVGEVVAVAQSYDKFRWPAPQRSDFPVILKSAGWRNKMYVHADLMLHRIRITNVRVERLQEISDEDCKREGINFFYADGIFGYGVGTTVLGNSPRNAFSSLINKVSGKCTWESNPWVFVYEFELVK